MPKSPGHDQRRCRFFARNPAIDYASLPADRDRSRMGIYLCLAKGKPLPTSMVKCRYCRDHNLWYQPLEGSPDYPQAAARTEGGA